jgi:molecular chaperone DnaK (HSP70)
MVTYAGDRRFFGDFALQQEMQHVQSTITELKRLICLPFDSPEREIIAKTVLFTLVALPDGTTGIAIPYTDTTIHIRPEQAIAALLKDLASVIRSQHESVSKFVIAVSPWWPDRHRRSMLTAARIAGIEVLGLVNSTTAAAVSYAMLQRARLPKSTESPAIVAFVDFGNSSMNVAIAAV